MLETFKICLLWPENKELYCWEDFISFPATYLMLTTVPFRSLHTLIDMKDINWNLLMYIFQYYYY